MSPRLRSDASLYRRSPGTQAGNTKGLRGVAKALGEQFTILIVIYLTMESAKLVIPALCWKPG
jgi:hypothetical protein